MCPTQQRVDLADADIAEAPHRTEVTDESVEPVSLATTEQIDVALEFARPSVRPVLAEPCPQGRERLDEFGHGVVERSPVESRRRIHGRESDAFADHAHRDGPDGLSLHLLVFE